MNHTRIIEVLDRLIDGDLAIARVYKKGDLVSVQLTGCQIIGFNHTDKINSITAYSDNNFSAAMMPMLVDYLTADRKGKLDELLTAALSHQLPN